MKQNICPPLNQIALSVIDLQVTERWFREGLGFLPAGGSRLMASGPLAALVQGLPRAASTMWWLVGRNAWFQIELFQFRRPMARLMPHDARPCDIGYRRFGVWVADFDIALGRLAALGSRPIGPVLGVAGDRRACVRSPDGVFVELLERDPLPQPSGSERAGCDVAVRSVTLSTPDLAATSAYLRAVSGRDPLPRPLHDAAHEALWGLDGARCRSAVFECGDVLVEAVQYDAPVGRPWAPDYRISDQGIVNIAFGARNSRDHGAVTARALAFGAQPNFRPLHLPGLGVVYVNDRLGFSVEVVWLAPWQDKQWGFVPLPLHQRPSADDRRVQSEVEIDAPLPAVWAVLNEHESMGAWIGFPRVTLAREGRPERNGRGAERLMQGLPGTVVEQVTEAVPMSRIRYRVVQGSPFVFHQGEIVLEPQGSGTRVTWTIRFRSKLPLLGGLWRALLQRMLERLLQRGLKAYVERSGQPAHQPV